MQTSRLKVVSLFIKICRHPLNKRRRKVSLRPTSRGIIIRRQSKQIFGKLSAIALGAFPGAKRSVMIKKVFQPHINISARRHFEKKLHRITHQVASLAKMPRMPRIRMEKQLRKWLIVRDVLQKNRFPDPWPLHPQRKLPFAWRW